LFVGRLIALLGRTETALSKFVCGNLAYAVIRSNLAEETIIGDVPLRDVIAAVPQLAYDLCLGFSKNIGILLEDLDDLLSREVIILGKRFSSKNNAEHYKS
jgi:hypothetical protein